MKNGRPQVAGRARAVTNAAIGQALRASGGIYSAASQWIAENIGVNYSRQAIAKRVQASPELQKVLEDTIEETIDVAESRLQELIASGNVTAILFYLRTKGKHRGYTERQEIAGVSGAGAPAAIQVQFIGAENGKEAAGSGR